MDDEEYDGFYDDGLDGGRIPDDGSSDDGATPRQLSYDAPMHPTPPSDPRPARAAGVGGMLPGSSPQGGGAQAALRAENAELREALAVAADGTAESRYFELLGRHRQLNVKFEAERARVAKLRQQVTGLEREKTERDLAAEQAARGGVVLPSERPAAKKPGLSPQRTVGGGVAPESDAVVLGRELEELQGRHDKGQRAYQMLRKQHEEAKREVARMKRVLALEVGDDAAKALAQLADEESTESGSVGTPTKDKPKPKPGQAAGWRGRAQQITVLRGKLKDVQRQLQQAGLQGEATLGGDTTMGGVGSAIGDDSNMTHRSAALRSVASGATAATAATGTMRGRDFDDVNRAGIERQGQERLKHQRELQREAEVQRTAAAKEKTRAEAMSARLQILERDNEHLKLCVQQMIAKTENDDRLVAAYKQEMADAKADARRAAKDAMNATNTANALQGTPRQGNGAPAAGRRPGQGGATEQQVADAKAQQRVAQLERELREATDSVAELRRRPAQAVSIPDPAVAGEGTALRAALEAVGEQHDALVALERHLQEQQARTAQLEQAAAKGEAKDGPKGRGRPESGDAAGSARTGVAALLRQENASLRERSAVLTATMEREVAVFRAAAAEAQEQQQQATAGAEPSAQGQAPCGFASAEKEAELVALKQQYGELKRAYNQMALQAQKA